MCVHANLLQSFPCSSYPTSAQCIHWIALYVSVLPEEPLGCRSDRLGSTIWFRLQSTLVHWPSREGGKGGVWGGGGGAHTSWGCIADSRVWSSSARACRMRCLFVRSCSARCCWAAFSSSAMRGLNVTGPDASAQPKASQGPMHSSTELGCSLTDHAKHSSAVTGCICPGFWCLKRTCNQSILYHTGSPEGDLAWLYCLMATCHRCCLKVCALPKRAKRIRWTRA